MALFIIRLAPMLLAVFLASGASPAKADLAPSGWSAYGYSYRCGGGGTVNGDTTNAAGKAQTYYDQKKACEIDNLQVGLDECHASHTRCAVYDIEDKPPYPHNGNIRYSYVKSIFYTDQECTDPVTFEPGGPDTASSCPQMCSQGYVQTSAPYHPDAGSPVSTGYDCMVRRTAPECSELGKHFNPTTFGGYCVEQCAQGSLGNQCLQPTDDEDEPDCSASDDDFKGVIGFGGEAVMVCGESENQCPEGSTYGFAEQSDGSYEASCFPPESNPPNCAGGYAMILGKDGMSFQCNEIRNPDADDPTDSSDGDSDDDGEGDMTGVAGQLQDIKNLLKKGNSDTGNINQTLKGIGKNIKDGTSAITEAIGNIPGGGGGGNGSGGDGDGDGGEGDGDGETEEDPVTWSGEPIDTELTDPEEDYNQVMNEYQDKINEIKNDVQAMFSTNLSGGGSVDDNTKTIMGVDVNFSLNRFLSGLDILGAIVLFCAAFISAGILFTSRG